MARLFNVCVYKNQVAGTGVVESKAEMAEMLGRADMLIVQAHIVNATGTNPTLTVKYQHSNDGEHWVDAKTLWNAQAISEVYDDVQSTGGTELGAFGRFQIELGGTSPAAFVQLDVCGRAQ